MEGYFASAGDAISSCSSDQGTDSILRSASKDSGATKVYHNAQTSVIVDEQALISFDEYLKKQLLINSHLNINNNRSSGIINFTKGFIIGQLSVIIIIVIFIRFFVFSESVPKSTSKGGKKKNKLITNETILSGNGISISAGGALSTLASGAKRSVGAVADKLVNGSVNVSSRKSTSISGSAADDDTNNEMVTLINTILEKTYYNVNTHQTESLDWFNVLVAQIITQFRTEALYEDNIINSLNDFLVSGHEKNKIPDWLDNIKINEINIGDDFPIFSNCRIIKNLLGKLEAKIDVDLSDTLTLALETKFLINKPKIMTAALPIKLSVSIVRFSGCLNISLDSIPQNENDVQKEQKKALSNKSEDDIQPLHLGGVLNFGFSSDYRLEFKTESLIGARSKLENVPKISYLIENQLQNWFVERCVEPRFQLIPLPNMWPRKKNTRGNV